MLNFVFSFHQFLILCLLTGIYSKAAIIFTFRLSIFRWPSFQHIYSHKGKGFFWFLQLPFPFIARSFSTLPTERVYLVRDVGNYSYHFHYLVLLMGTLSLSLLRVLLLFFNFPTILYSMILVTKCGDRKKKNSEIIAHFHWDKNIDLSS